MNIFHSNERKSTVSGDTRWRGVFIPCSRLLINTLNPRCVFQSCIFCCDPTPSFNSEMQWCRWGRPHCTAQLWHFKTLDIEYILVCEYFATICCLLLVGCIDWSKAALTQFLVSGCRLVCVCVSGKFTTHVCLSYPVWCPQTMLGHNHLIRNHTFFVHINGHTDTLYALCFPQGGWSLDVWCVKCFKWKHSMSADLHEPVFGGWKRLLAPLCSFVLNFIFILTRTAGPCLDVIQNHYYICTAIFKTTTIFALL